MSVKTNNISSSGQSSVASKSVGQSIGFAALLLTTSVVLTACGGGSGDTSPNQPSGNAPVVVKQLDGVSDLQLQQAARAGSAQMRSGVSGMQGFAAQSNAEAVVNNDTMSRVSKMLGMSGESSSDVEASQVTDGENDGGYEFNGTDEYGTDHNDSADYGSDGNGADNFGSDEDMWELAGMDALMDITLGLSGNANITRNGNRVTIDPDDSALCDLGTTDDTEFVQESAAERAFCMQMVSDLIVHIDGQTEDSGRITYEYQQTPAVIFEYAPTTAALQLRMPGIHKVMLKANSIAPTEFSSVPEVFDGVIDFAVSVDNEELGAEAGSMSVSISSPIRVSESSSQFNLNVAASNVLNVVYDNAAGTASLEMDAGASNLSFLDGKRYELSSSGSSVKVDLVGDGEKISVSRLGFKNGPLTLTIDSVEVIRMTLDRFGFDIDTINEQLTMTGDMNFNLAVNLWELFSEVADSEQETGQMTMGSASLELSVKAPTGALFSAQNNGSVKLDNAGPFAIDFYSDFNGEPSAINFAANPGECYIESDEPNTLFSLTVCD